MLKSVEWIGGKDGYLKILDQRLLPSKIEWCEIRNIEELLKSIKEMYVRGAPAIGMCAGFGMYIGSKDIKAKNFQEFVERLKQVKKAIENTRPTAVNLFWATNRIYQKVKNFSKLGLEEIKEKIFEEATLIYKEEIEVCKNIGRVGEKLIKDGMRVLTHCNAGALATGLYGTALSVIYAAVEKGKRVEVYADETRPLLQGSRLTAFELKENKIPVSVICDNMAGFLMKQKKVDIVIVGADRIAINGDVANKIGTYSLSILARYHGIPFYVAAPLSTIDFSIYSGNSIPIEIRNSEEIEFFNGKRVVPPGVSVYNPAFDITPHQNITAIITEVEIIYPPFDETLKKIKDRPR